MLCAAATLALAGTGVPLLAQPAWPNRPLRLVVPYPPGGATDVIGRIVATRLSAALQQQVVVDNKGGAGGNVGAGEAARAAPDGYTLLMGAMTAHSTMMTLEKGRLKYDLVKDFRLTHTIGYVPLVFVVNPAVPVNSFQELVAYAEASPHKLSYASSGAAAPQRLAAEIFRRHVGVELLHVPYKGSGPAMTDLVGGQVQMMAETVPAALQFIKSGKLRALAVTTPQRISLLPEVPTIAESVGWADAEVVSTFGVLVPTATPESVVLRLNREIGTMLQSPEVRAQLLQQGVYAAPPQTLPQAAQRLREEVVRWEKVIRETGIKADE